MSDLKRCPFCGGKASLEIHGFVGLDDTYGIVCVDCGASTNRFYKMISQAKGAWNRRVGQKNCY